MRQSGTHATILGHSWQFDSKELFFKNGPIPASFSLFSTFQYRQLTVNVQYKFLLMTRLELQTSEVGNDRSTIWATTTDNLLKKFTVHLWQAFYLFAWHANLPEISPSSRWTRAPPAPSGWGAEARQCPLSGRKQCRPSRGLCQWQALIKHENWTDNEQIQVRYQVKLWY